MTKQELFQKADDYKEMIDTIRPFNKEKLSEFDNYFRVRFTYSSNSLEGNMLTLSDTKLLLEDGFTVGGKPIKDYYEAAGHAQAYDYMLSMTRTVQLDITEDIIKRLHLLFYQKVDQDEAGQYRKIQVSGANHNPPKPEELEHFMGHFINQMQSSKRLMHPIEYAAICHKRLLDIHPFKEGNGRIARLLMNLLLVNAGYVITSIQPVHRNDYNNALALSQRKSNPDIDVLIEFIAECVIAAEKEYCELLRIQ